MVIGFFQNIILDGSTNAFFQAFSLLKIVCAAVTMGLCYYHVKGVPTLMIAALFGLNDYERPFWILPSLLILMIQPLLENRPRWIQTWILLCFLNGIYYPTYGGALLVGTFPFTLIQIYSFIKDGELIFCERIFLH